MSIFDYNGNSMLAMKGKNCVAIATDTRLGVQLQTVSQSFQRVFKVNDRILMGLGGLGTDVQTFSAKVKSKTNLYKLEEHRDIDAQVFTDFVANALFEKRFGPYFIQPIIAGLTETEKGLEPVIATYDSIGCKEQSYFACGGTGGELLYGVCETFYKEDMEPDELFETVSQCLLSAMDRDILSGWGATVYILTPDEIICKNLKTRQD